MADWHPRASKRTKAEEGLSACRSGSAASPAAVIRAGGAWLSRETSLEKLECESNVEGDGGEQAFRAEEFGEELTTTLVFAPPLSKAPTALAKELRMVSLKKAGSARS